MVHPTKVHRHFLTECILLPSYVYNMHQDTKSARSCMLKRTGFYPEWKFRRFRCNENRIWNAETFISLRSGGVNLLIYKWPPPSRYFDFFMHACTHSPSSRCETQGKVLYSWHRLWKSIFFNGMFVASTALPIRLMFHTKFISFSQTWSRSPLTSSHGEQLAIISTKQYADFKFLKPWIIHKYQSKKLTYNHYLEIANGEFSWFYLILRTGSCGQGMER